MLFHLAFRDFSVPSSSRPTRCIAVCTVSKGQQRAKGSFIPGSWTSSGKSSLNTSSISSFNRKKSAYNELPREGDKTDARSNHSVEHGAASGASNPLITVRLSIDKYESSHNLPAAEQQLPLAARLLFEVMDGEKEKPQCDYLGCHELLQLRAGGIMTSPSHHRHATQFCWRSY